MTGWTAWPHSTAGTCSWQCAPGRLSEEWLSEDCCFGKIVRYRLDLKEERPACACYSGPGASRPQRQADVCMSHCKAPGADGRSGCAGAALEPGGAPEARELPQPGRRRPHLWRRCERGPDGCAGRAAAGGHLSRRARAAARGRPPFLTCHAFSPAPMCSACMRRMQPGAAQLRFFR